ncbi:MAG: helicase-exonuclease AddAB subunit AddA [Ruminococcaceae bacterium]|nr:helicase-exonuclease AddAB subunit AddA [Oscillospiraceae bacterium]
MSVLRLTAAQQAVVENRGGSLLVSAAAGSGKTKVLVERLFRYITEENCNVDDFLIITYTKAAAAELRNKIAEELSARLAERPDDAHLRRQLLLVYRADIRTVDAFCTSLLRENTHLLSKEEDRSSLSPDFRVLDENEAQMLREKILGRTLERFYENLDESGTELAETLGFGRDDRALETLVLELYQKLQSHAWPERWLAESTDFWVAMSNGGVCFDDTVYAKLLLESIQRKAEHWGRLLTAAAEGMADCPALQKGYADRFQMVAEKLLELEKSAGDSGWDAASELAASLVFPKLGAVKAADGGEQKVRAQKLWGGCKDAVKAMRGVLNVSAAEAVEDLAAVAPAMLALLRLAGEFAADYRKEKLRLNTIDFSDQEHLALTLLVNDSGEPTELGAQIASRYVEILVDEYQDTNEVQNAIFRAVSRDEKNLFAVGDVKQSIYRFRLADPSIFLERYQSFLPYQEAKEGQPRKILLSKNFRSRREILDAANFIFENILSREMGEIDYGEEEALHFGAEYYPPRNDCDTEFHLISCQRKRGDQDLPVKRLTAEARFVAKRIRELLDAGYPVTDKNGKLRPCRPEDIVILMRAPGSRSAAYAAALAEQEVSCAEESNEDFFAAMEVSTVLSFLKIIDNPRQDVPLIAVLRSPIFAFSPDRLAQIRGNTPEGDFYSALKRDENSDTQAFLKILTELRLLACDVTVYRLLWQLYNRLNVLGVFGTMEGGARRRENLIALTEQAKKLEGSGCRGVFAFVRRITGLLETGRAPQIRGAADTAGVRIMSIHKSKGLEFPIVILTDLDHAFSRQDIASSVLVHPKLGLGPTRVELARRIRYPTLARRALEFALLRENRAEEQRLLYVAMTRPKEKLILVNAMYSAANRIKKLAPLAACPSWPEAVGEGTCFADWLLLPLLCRPEAAPLRELGEVGVEALYTGDTSAWKVFTHDSEDYRSAPESKESRNREEEKNGEVNAKLLSFRYRYEKETGLPAKITATQMKGRELDREAAEHTTPVLWLRPLSQPKFRQAGGGLTAAEKGTATHLVLQYLDFHNEDVAGQVTKLQERRLLTEAQAEAVDVPALECLLRSDLAERLRSAGEVFREYPFTVLLPAAVLEPTACEGDTVLLQGVVDCFFAEEDGSLTVVDFKTDRVSGTEVIRRGEEYRVQLETYSAALERVLERPVGRKVLYFLHPGKTVEL